MSERAGTVWWDFDGTLVYRPSMWARTAIELLQLARPSREVCAERLEVEFSRGMPWHRPCHSHPELTTASLWWRAVADRYAEVFATLGYDDAVTSRLGAQVRTIILDAQRYTVFPDAAPAMQVLQKEGWRQVIISNHVPELSQIVEALGFGRYISKVLTSGQVGYEKPDPRIFALASADLHANERVWMIGDSPEADCIPAAMFGARPILVRNAHAQHPTAAADLWAATAMIV